MKVLSDVTISLAIQTAIQGAEIVEEVGNGEVYWDELLQFVSNARSVGCATNDDVKRIKSKECNVGRLKEIDQCLKSKIPSNAPSRPKVRL